MLWACSLETRPIFLSRRMDRRLNDDARATSIRATGPPMTGPANIPDATPPTLGRRTTLRVRLLVALAVLFAIGLSGFGLVTTSLYSRTLSDRLDAQLHAATPLMGAHLLAQAGVADHASPLQESGGPPSDSNQRGPSAANGGHDPSLFIPPGTWGELLSSTGKVLAVAAASTSAGKPSVPTPLPGAGTVVTVPPASGTATWRFVASPSPGGTTTIVAVATSDLNASLTRLITIELLVGLGLLLLVSTAASLLITRSLKPLEDMAETATAIAGGDLTRRVDVETSARELDELRRALNAMLDDIEASFAERQAVEQRLRQFLADASHELRTPLTSIAGFAEILRLGGSSTIDSSLAANRIESEAARMSRLIDDLLLLARMDEVESEPLGEVDLTVIAADACSDAAATDPTRPITLDAPSPAWIVGIEDHLRQAVGNLMTNALRYTPSGSPLDVSVMATEAMVILTVADRGPGIPDESLDKVFNRFFQVDPSRTGSGSGLGLSIVAAVCEESGGEAHARNREGGGLAVELTLPAARSSRLSPA